MNARLFILLIFAISTCPAGSADLESGGGLHNDDHVVSRDVNVPPSGDYDDDTLSSASSIGRGGDAAPLTAGSVSSNENKAKS